MRVEARKTLDEAHSDAVKNCKAERTADPAAFAAKYGTNKNGKNALGKCVSQTERELKTACGRRDRERRQAVQG